MPNDEVNSVDNNGEYPLHKAYSDGNLEIVKLLIEKGTKLNVVDKIGKTLLDYAYSGGHLKIVRLLIKNGFEIKVLE